MYSKHVNIFSLLSIFFSSVFRLLWLHCLVTNAQLICLILHPVHIKLQNLCFCSSISSVLFRFTVFFFQHAETLTFKTLSVRVLLNSGCDVNYLGQTACRVEDFLSVSWVSDPKVSEILVLHHVTSLRVKKCTETQANKSYSVIQPFPHTCMCDPCCVVYICFLKNFYSVPGVSQAVSTLISSTRHSL